MALEISRHARFITNLRCGDEFYVKLEIIWKFGDQFGSYIG